MCPLERGSHGDPRRCSSAWDPLPRSTPSQQSPLLLLGCVWDPPFIEYLSQVSQ